MRVRRPHVHQIPTRIILQTVVNMEPATGLFFTMIELGPCIGRTVAKIRPQAKTLAFFGNELTKTVYPFAHLKGVMGDAGADFHLLPVTHHSTLIKGTFQHNALFGSTSPDAGHQCHPGQSQVWQTHRVNLVMHQFSNGGSLGGLGIPPLLLIMAGILNFLRQYI